MRGKPPPAVVRVFRGLRLGGFSRMNRLVGSKARSKDTRRLLLEELENRYLNSSWPSIGSLKIFGVHSLLPPFSGAFFAVPSRARACARDGPRRGQCAAGADSPCSARVESTATEGERGLRWAVRKPTLPETLHRGGDLIQPRADREQSGTRFSAPSKVPRIARGKPAKTPQNTCFIGVSALRPLSSKPP